MPSVGTVRGGRWIEMSSTAGYWQINRDFEKWPLNRGQTVVESEDDSIEIALDIEIQETLQSLLTSVEEQESEVHIFLFC